MVWTPTVTVSYGHEGQFDSHESPVYSYLGSLLKRTRGFKFKSLNKTHGVPTVTSSIPQREQFRSHESPLYS